MTAITFIKESSFPCPAEILFRWHEKPDAFLKLMPPGEPVKLLHHDGHIRDGARVTLSVGYRPCCVEWKLEHQEYIQHEQFCDVQIKGPFKSWKHVHRMISTGPHSSILSDCITFEMPWGDIGNRAGKMIVLPKLQRLFDYRHKITLKECSP